MSAKIQTYPNVIYQNLKQLNYAVAIYLLLHQRSWSCRRYLLVNFPHIISTRMLGHVEKPSTILSTVLFSNILSAPHPYQAQHSSQQLTYNSVCSIGIIIKTLVLQRLLYTLMHCLDYFCI